MIELRVLLPEKTYWHGAVKKIIGESTDGFFCLLTRHVDFVTIMTPGIFFILTEKDEEVYIAINEGILIKINDIYPSKKHRHISTYNPNNKIKAKASL